MAQRNGPEPVPVGPARTDFLAEVAALYYHEGLNQDHVAQQIGVSRSTVSRLLAEALASGVVEIRIRGGLVTDSRLQKALVATLGIKDALVVQSWPGARDSLRRVGRLAARYLDSRLDEGDLLAVSWGGSVRAVVDGLHPHIQRNIEVVQILGGSGGDPAIDGPEVAQRLASLLGGRARYLNAPLLVDEVDVAEMLRRQVPIREVLEIAEQADFALLGVGSTEPGRSALHRAGYLDEDQLAQIRAAGMVGDVCGHLFDISGVLADDELSRRVVSVSSEVLRSLPRSIAVAAGPAKVAPLLGAVRAGLVNVIVTDDVTAAAVLELAGVVDR